MNTKDILRRFLFDDLAIRGEWVNLTDSWQAAKKNHAYPEAVIEQLGEALAAVTLLSATIKFEGNLILQVQGNGALNSLVAHSSHKQHIRGWARCDNQATEKGFSQLMGDGQMVITIKPEKGEPYQGIVPLIGDKIETAIENYFTQSEQLKTRLWLFADENHAAGLFIQELPTENKIETEQQWQHIEALANTVTQEELLTLPCEEMLHRLFHEEKLRLFEPETVQFQCQCSNEKLSATLLSLGKAAVEELLVEQEEIVAECEFCSSKYRFDNVDVAQIFANPTGYAHSTTKH